MKTFCLVLLCVLFGIFGTSISNAVESSLHKVSLSQVEIADGNLGIQNPQGLQFHTVDPLSINRGYVPTNLWLHFFVENYSDQTEEVLLALDSPLVGRLTLFKGNQELAVTGPGVPLNERAYHSRLGRFLINLQPHEKAQFYLRSETHHAVNTQLKIETPADAQSAEDIARAVFYFYFGGMAALALYNLFLGFFTHEKAHISYALFAGSFGITVLVLHGIFDAYLLPQGEFVFSNHLMIFSAITAITAGFFVGQFLGIDRDFKVGFWGLRILTALAVVPFIAGFFANTHRELFYLGYWIDINIALLILFSIYCGFYVFFKNRNPLASYFLVSWLIVLLGAFAWIGSLHGLLPTGVLTQYSLLFGNLGEMVILSLGLAYKIRTLDIEKRAAQRAAEDKDRYHRLVRVLSHDIANTVSGFAYHTAMLLEKCDGTPAEEHVRRIDRGVEQVSDVLRSVRQEVVLYSTREYGQFGSVDLQMACHEALGHFSWQLQQKNLHAVVEIPPNVLVRADRAALVNQVLSNLISNSIKFSENGGHLTFSVKTQNRKVFLALKDEGTGILPEELPHLFKAKKVISRLGTSNEKGTGIGASLVGEYMNLFGGEVCVQSTHRSQSARSGTTVELIFPRP